MKPKPPTVQWFKPLTDEEYIKVMREHLSALNRFLTGKDRKDGKKN